MNVFPGETEVKKFDHVDVLLKREALEVSVPDLVESEIDRRVEAADAGLAAKGHDISGRSQVPVLMAPHLASAAYACLGFIDNEDDLVVLGNLSQTLVEVGSGHVISECGDWLNDDSCHVLASVSPLLHDISDLLKAAVLLGSVFDLELSHGIANLGEGGSGPLISRHILEIHSLVTG